MKKTLSNIIEDNRDILLGTLITSIILIITFAFSGYYPFGENSILKVDLYHQYAPFHEELRNKLLTGDSLFYSWEGGLGKEFLSQIAYYTSSPISLLILLFPSKFISEAILLFVFIKISLCSFTFGYFLKKSFNKNTIFIVIFSVMYAFMAYISSFYWNIMWLDSIYLFPIVALGINRLVKDGSYKTYLFSLILCIIVNFYIAFLVCIFATLYFLVKVFSTYNIKEDFKIIMDRFLKFGILSLLAGGTTMILAVPTVVALGRTQTVETTFPSFEIYQNVYQLITSHFSGVKPVVLARNEDLPNLYSGVLTMMLLPTYFFNKEIKLKEKFLFGGLIIFMLACSVFKQLDFIIHGNHFPANLPHRYTFIYSFIILALAYKSIIYIKGIRPIVMYIFIGIYTTIILTTEFLLINFVDDIAAVLSNMDILANVLLMAIYTLLILAYKKYKDNPPAKNIKGFTNFTGVIFTFLSFIIFFVAIWYNSPYFRNDLEEAIKIPISFYILTIIFAIICILAGLFLIKSLTKLNFSYKLTILITVLIFVTTGESLFNSVKGFLHSGSTSRANYNQYIDSTDKALDYIKENDNDENKFFRQEFNRFTAINESTLYHYNGFSTFSSLAYGDTSKLIENLGVAATSNSYRYYDPTPLLDSMFNIKYIMTKDKILENDNYEALATFDEIGIYKNKYPLSVGFMVDKDIKNWETEQDTPFITQNEFIYKTTNVDEEILTPVHIMNFNSENVEITKKDDKPNDFSYVLDDETNLDLIPTVTCNLYNPKTQRLFIYVESTNSKRFKYTINGHTNDREISTGRSLIDLGIVQSGEIVNLEFSLDRKGAYEKTYSRTGDFRVYSAGFNTDVYEEAYSQLDDEMFIVDEYDSTSLNGRINAKEDGIMFTSIPYDKAFKAYVDGEETEISPVGNDGLISIPIKAGEHTISFKYKSEKFMIGVLLTLISLAGIALYAFIDRKKRNTL